MDRGRRRGGIDLDVSQIIKRLGAAGVALNPDAEQLLVLATPRVESGMVYCCQVLAVKAGTV